MLVRQMFKSLDERSENYLDLSRKYKIWFCLHKYRSGTKYSLNHLRITH